MKEHILDIKVNLKQPWLLSVLCVTCIPFFPEYISPILAALSLIAAYSDAKQRSRYIEIGSVGKLILIYIAFMIIGLLYSPHVLSTLSTLTMWVVMFCVYLAMTTVLFNRHRFDSALFCISIIAGIIGIIGFLQYLARIAGFDVPLQFWGFADDVIFKWLPLTLLPPTDDLRVSSTFNNPNILGEYLVMVLPFVIYYSFSGKRTGYRIFCRFCLLAAVSGILFAFSRGCYLSVLVILAFFCFAYRRNIKTILMAAVSVFLLIPDSVFARFCSITGMDGSINERLAIWNYGIRSIKDHPLFGVGAGVSNTWDMLLSAGINAPHMHNIILQLFAEGGIIAVVLLAAVALKIIRSSLDMFHADEEANRMGIVFMAFVAAFFVDGMFDFPLLTPKLVGVFMMVLAFVDSALKIYLGRDNYLLRELIPYTRRYKPVEKELRESTEFTKVYTAFSSEQVRK